MKIRGSIPLFWSQPETWKLKPLIVPITDLSKHAIALKTHLLDLVKYYMYRGLPSFSSEKYQDEIPAIIMINLIDKNGSQGKLGN
jgi:SacI homology domain